MQGIVQKIMANPGAYSVQMLMQAMQSGSVPAYVAIPLIQDKVAQQKQMQQTGMGGQPPVQNEPPIAEQVMQEAQGLPGLSTNLPQEYAGGGIVAFDEGGPVERFQVGGVSGDGGLKAAQQAVIQARERLRPFGMVQRMRDPEGYKAAVSAVTAAEAAARASEPQAATFNPSMQVIPERNVPPESWKRPTAAEAAPAPVTPVTPTAPRPGIDTLRTPPPLAAPAPAPVAPPPMPTLGMPPGPTNLQRAETAAADMRGLSAMEEQYANQRIQDLRGQLTGKPFEEYKQRLEGEARQSGADKADAKNMALIKAGLAMMAGTSQHALQNIGQGAMVGVADWQSATKDFRKAERDRGKELALIEQAERAESRGDIKEQMTLLGQARDRRLASESAMTNMLLNAGVADNKGDAARLAAIYDAETRTSIVREQTAAQKLIAREQTAAQERIAALERASRMEVANIGATSRGGVRPMTEAATAKLLQEIEADRGVQKTALASLNPPLTKMPDPKSPAYPLAMRAVRKLALSELTRYRAATGGAPEAPAQGTQSGFRLLPD